MVADIESNGRTLPESGPVNLDRSNALDVNSKEHKFEQFRLFALAGITGVLIALCFLLAVPFLSAITWGVALAIIAWPMHRWIGDRLNRPILAALLSTAAVVMVIVAPSLFVTYQLTREAAGIAVQVKENSGGGTLREKMVESPALEPIVAWMDQFDVQVEAEVRKLIASYTQEASGIVQGSFSAIIQFLVAMFILYFLFLDRGMFLRGLRDLLPLSRAESEKVLARAADSVHANLYATLVTSLINTTGFTLMFWALGLPAPLLWGVVMFVLSILPIVGAALVWFPAAVYLALTGSWLAGMALLGLGLVSFVVVDNFIYAKLAGQRMRMHQVLTLIAFLGGIAVFGLSGIILGPAILAVTMTFLEVWKWRLAKNEINVPEVSRNEAGIVS